MKKIRFLLLYLSLLLVLIGCSDNTKTDIEIPVLIDHSFEDKPGSSVNTSPTVLYEQKTDIEIPVLMYHSFEDKPGSSVNTSPAVLHEQLSYLQKQGYTTIFEKDIFGFLEGEKKLPEKPLVITADDGYENNYKYFYPTIKKLGMKATIFVIVNSRGKKPGDFQHFTWGQAKEMYDSGSIEIQSHTNDLHYYITTIENIDKPGLSHKKYINGVEETDTEYIARVREDIRESKRIIEEKIGNEVISITYPYGSYNDEVISVLKEEGFKLGYTTNLGVVSSGDSQFILNRISVNGNDSGADLLDKMKLASDGS